MTSTPQEQHDSTPDPEAGARLADLIQAPTVQECMAQAMGAVRAVGKWGRNEQQNYAFRSIDHFMTALNPAMAAAGVVVVPRVLSRLSEDRERTTSSGRPAVTRCIDLEVAFRFYGPAGDYVEAITWGEATDTADKATNKAMTAAFKYAIMQTFMVPTEDLRDGDRDHVERPGQWQPGQGDQRAQEAPQGAEPTGTAGPTAQERQRAVDAAWAGVQASVAEDREALSAIWRQNKPVLGLPVEFNGKTDTLGNLLMYLATPAGREAAEVALAEPAEPATPEAEPAAEEAPTAEPTPEETCGVGDAKGRLCDLDVGHSGRHHYVEVPE